MWVCPCGPQCSPLLRARRKQLDSDDDAEIQSTGEDWVAQSIWGKSQSSTEEFQNFIICSWTFVKHFLILQRNCHFYYLSFASIPGDCLRISYLQKLPATLADQPLPFGGPHRHDPGEDVGRWNRAEAGAGVRRCRAQDQRLIRRLCRDPHRRPEHRRALPPSRILRGPTAGRSRRPDAYGQDDITGCRSVGCSAVRAIDWPLCRRWRCILVTALVSVINSSRTLSLSFTPIFNTKKRTYSIHCVDQILACTKKLIIIIIIVVIFN